MTGHTIWLMGLSGAGKTTLASQVNRKFTSNRYVILDADRLRHYVNSDLGYDDASRNENIRRAIGFCNILNRQKFNVIASFMTPTHLQQKMVKDTIKNVMMVYVNADIDTCIKRNVKGLYGADLKNIVGLDLPFEVPTLHNLEINTMNKSVQHCAIDLYHAITQKTKKDFAKKEESKYNLS